MVHCSRVPPKWSGYSKYKRRSMPSIEKAQLNRCIELRFIFVMVNLQFTDCVCDKGGWKFGKLDC